MNALDLWIVAKKIHLTVTNNGVLFNDSAISKNNFVEQRATKQFGLEVRTNSASIALHVFNPEAKTCFAIVFANNEFLCNVDETTCEVTRVSGTKCGVDESFTCTRSSNEVLECFEAFTEVALDRTRNHVTTRVRHETTHTCDLTHLRHVSASTRAHHHVDGVKAISFELFNHCGLHFGSCFGPDCYFLLTTLTIGDDAATELCFYLVGLLFEVVENFALLLWRANVFNRNSQT